MKIYRPSEECVRYWPEAENVQSYWWRFAWMKRGYTHGMYGNTGGKRFEVPFDTRPKIDMWGYRYTPLCGRLWWKEKWLGTKDNLFPFRALIRALPSMIKYILIVCAISASLLHSAWSIWRWILK